MIQILFLFIFHSTPSFAEANGTKANIADQLTSLIRKNLEDKINNAEIRLPSLNKLMSLPPMSNFTEIKLVKFIEEKTNGLVRFEVNGKNNTGNEIRETVQTPYEAWRKVPVAIHRIYPNVRLKNEDFKIQDINISIGNAREFRGVMCSADTNFNLYQTQQSILEGQYAVLSAIQKVPDIRKGDTIKLELISGGLTLTTQAVTQESGSVGAQIRVLTTKSKRELIGFIKEDHSVEVTL